MVFQVEATPVLVEVHPFNSAFSMSADSVQCHCAKEGSHLIEFHIPLPGVFLSLCSPFYAHEKQLPISPLLGLRCEVSWSVIVFPLLLHTQTLHLAILAIFNASHMLDCYRCTQPSCHSSWHVENIEEFSCCFWNWDSAITSTMYGWAASLSVLKRCFIHSRGPFSRNQSTKIPTPTTSCSSILRTVQKNAFVDHGGFMSMAAIYWSCSSVRTPIINYSLEVSAI